MILLLLAKAPAPAPTTGTPIGLLLALTHLSISSTVIEPDGIASIAALGSPVLSTQSDLDLIYAAWDDFTHPLFRFIVNGTLVIDEDRLLLYDERQTGRLGRAEVDIVLSNADNALTAYLGAALTPRHQVQVLIGARDEGIDYRTQRHTLVILDITPTNFKNSTNALRLRCENNWNKFRTPAASNLAWTAAPIGDIVDDLAAANGIIVNRDASTFWAHTLTRWQSPAGLPAQPVISDLIGDGQRAHALACGRFDPEGKWIVEGLYPSPATDYELADDAAYDSSLAYRGDVATRYQITGNNAQVTGCAPELEALLGEQRIHITNAYTLPATALNDRLLQEATEHRERYYRGTLNLRPDPRLQLWHVVKLYNVANVANGTQFRVTEIRFVYGGGQFAMDLTLRSVTTLATTTVVDVIPIIEPPTPPIGPPPVIPPPEATMSDDFDTYDTGLVLTDYWSFLLGTWSIAEDTTDAAPFVLAQTASGAGRYTALRQGNYVSTNYFYGGIVLKAEGAAGLLAFTIDKDNGYEIEIDSVTNTVELVRWIKGNPYTLHSASRVISINVPYIVGLQRHGKHLRAYCKSLATNTQTIFSAANLIANKVDTTYSQGRVGFTSYGIAARFFSVRAGVSGQFACNYSDRTHPRGHHHCTGAKWYECSGTADRGTWHTETITLPQLARRCKALIDDLRNDHLIHD